MSTVTVWRQKKLINYITLWMGTNGSPYLTLWMGTNGPPYLILWMGTNGPPYITLWVRWLFEDRKLINYITYIIIIILPYIILWMGTNIPPYITLWMGTNGPPCRIQVSLCLLRDFWSLAVFVTASLLLAKAELFIIIVYSHFTLIGQRFFNGIY